MNPNVIYKLRASIVKKTLRNMNNSNMKNSNLEKFLIDFIYFLYFIHMSLSYQPTANNCVVTIDNVVVTIWFSFK